MADLTLAYQVRSGNAGARRRAGCNAGERPWAANGVGGDEISAGKLLLQERAAVKLRARVETVRGQVQSRRVQKEGPNHRRFSP